jgi:hypothetical protein
MSLSKLLISSLLMSNSLYAAELPQQIKCSARIALNRILNVEVDRTSREMSVVADSGSRWEGNASKQVSISSDVETYNLSFLKYPSTQPAQLGLRVGQNGDHTLCFAPTECYICQ